MFIWKSSAKITNQRLEWKELRSRRRSSLHSKALRVSASSTLTTTTSPWEVGMTGSFPPKAFMPIFASGSVHATCLTTWTRPTTQSYNGWCTIQTRRYSTPRAACPQSTSRCHCSSLRTRRRRRWMWRRLKKWLSQAAVADDVNAVQVFNSQSPVKCNTS